MIRSLFILILFSAQLNGLKAQEKITVHCKINFYKESASDTANRLNIVFEPLVRFAKFEDKAKIEKLKYYEASITAGQILKYMKFLGWHLLHSAHTKDLGDTFYFQKVLNKSSIDFIPKVQLKPLS